MTFEIELCVQVGFFGYILFKSILKFVLFRISPCINDPFYFKLYHLYIEKSLFCTKFNTEKNISNSTRNITEKKEENILKKKLNSLRKTFRCDSLISNESSFYKLVDFTHKKNTKNFSGSQQNDILIIQGKDR